MKKRLLKILTASMVIALIIITQAGCGNKEPVTGSTEQYLDTRCEITIYDMPEKKAQAIITDAFQEVAKYEKLFSKTVRGSDVDRINQAAGKEVKVDDDTAKAIQAGIEAGEYSGGNFDITVGRITELWDFKSENPQLPSKEQLDSAVATVGYENIAVKGNRVSISNPEAELDLGGIAKGYVADRLTEYLEGEGVESAIINLGGNVVAIGSKDDGQKFVIGVERPYTDRTEIIGSIAAEDMTLVTAGIYERKFEKDGVTYHHILNPETGYPSDSDIESVTITAAKGNSAFCDGLSTSCLMAGVEGATKLVEAMQKKYPEKQIEALFIDRNDNITKTRGMKLNPVE